MLSGCINSLRVPSIQALTPQTNRSIASLVPETSISCTKNLIQLLSKNNLYSIETAFVKAIKSSNFLDEAVSDQVLSKALYQLKNLRLSPDGLTRKKANKILKSALLLGHPKLHQSIFAFKENVEESYLLLLERKLSEKSLVDTLKLMGLYKKSLLEKLHIPSLILNQTSNALEISLSVFLLLKHSVLVPPVPKIEFLPSKQELDHIVNIIQMNGGLAAKEYVLKKYPNRAIANYVYDKIQKTYVYVTTAAIAYMVYQSFQTLNELHTENEKATQEAQSFITDLIETPIRPEDAEANFLENMLDTMEAAALKKGQPFDRAYEQKQLYQEAGVSLP